MDEFRDHDRRIAELEAERDRLQEDVDDNLSDHKQKLYEEAQDAYEAHRVPLYFVIIVAVVVQSANIAYFNFGLITLICFLLGGGSLIYLYATRHKSPQNSKAKADANAQLSTAARQDCQRIKNFSHDLVKHPYYIKLGVPHYVEALLFIELIVAISAKFSHKNKGSKLPTVIATYQGVLEDICGEETVKLTNQVFQIEGSAERDTEVVLAEIAAVNFKGKHNLERFLQYCKYAAALKLIYGRFEKSDPVIGALLVSRYNLDIELDTSENQHSTSSASTGRRHHA